MCWKGTEACAASKPTCDFRVQGSLDFPSAYDAIGGLFESVTAEREKARAKAEQGEADLKQANAKVIPFRDTKFANYVGEKKASGISI